VSAAFCELRDQTSSVGVKREAVEIRGRARGGWRTARFVARSYRNRKSLPPASVAKGLRGRRPARSGPHPTARKRYASCRSSHLLWCGASDKSARAASRGSTCRRDPWRAPLCSRTRAAQPQHSPPGTPASRKPSTQDAGGRRTWTRQLTTAIRRYDGTHPRAESCNPNFRKRRRLSQCVSEHRLRAGAPAPGDGSGSCEDGAELELGNRRKRFLRLQLPAAALCRLCVVGLADLGDAQRLTARRSRTPDRQRHGLARALDGRTACLLGRLSTAAGWWHTSALSDRRKFRSDS